MEIPRSGVPQTYLDAVVAAGGAPIAIPLGLDVDALYRVYQLIDGLLLPGGEDVAPERFGQERHAKLGAVDEARDEIELTLAKWALEDDLPVLGICRGIQLLAVAAGGSLYQDIPAELEGAIPHNVRGRGRDHLGHRIEIASPTLLSESLGVSTVEVNSFHHQAVRDVPDSFVVSARAEDGVIEAIESPSHSYAIGIQCHPEAIWQTTAPTFSRLFSSFVEAAGVFARRGVVRARPA
jgi:putative glutamine amidotransferase